MKDSRVSGSSSSSSSGVSVQSEFNGSTGQNQVEETPFLAAAPDLHLESGHPILPSRNVERQSDELVYRDRAESHFADPKARKASRHGIDPRNFEEVASLVSFLNEGSNAAVTSKPILAPGISKDRTAPRYQIMRTGRDNSKRLLAGSSRKRRTSDENSANDRRGGQRNVEESELRKSARLINGVGHSSAAAEDLSLEFKFGDLQSGHTFVGPAVVSNRRAMKELGIVAGETSQMLEKVAKHKFFAAAVSPQYTDTPPKTVSYQEFADEAMLHYESGHHRYAQVLIWCLSRRMSILAARGTTSHSMRLIHILGSLRSKIRDGSLELFAYSGLGGLSLKPIQRNPKNERSAEDLKLFTEFSEQLESSKHDGISILDAAEKSLTAASDQSPIVCASPIVETEWNELTEMRSAVHAHMRYMVVQSLKVESLVDDARELIGEVQNRYIEARCDNIFEVSRD